MRKDERDILEVLKAELAFLEKGGYVRSPHESWRQPLIFEDSPSCANYDSANHSVPCSECVLFSLVPPQFRGKQIPCRHIPFNAEGETLDSLGPCSEQFEIEELFGKVISVSSIKREDIIISTKAGIRSFSDKKTKVRLQSRSAGHAPNFEHGFRRRHYSNLERRRNRSR